MDNKIYMRIRNYGPLSRGSSALDSGLLEFPKYTILIGNQGAGKSTVAKLFSTLSWLEKAFIRKNYESRTFNLEGLLTLLENQNLPREYINESTEIEYIGQSHIIWLNKGKVRVSLRSNSEYRCPQIIYYPSERNVLSVIDNPFAVDDLPAMVKQLASEFLNANRKVGRRKRQLFGGYKIEFDPDSRKSYIIDPEGKTSVVLSKSSSGLQSIAPLFVVSDYLSKGIGEDFLDKLKKENGNIREVALRSVEDPLIGGKLKFFLDSGLKDNMSDDDVAYLKEALGKYVNSCLWQIVEEPEQNLYPTSQVEVVKKLIDNTGEDGKLVLTTHSPYILSVMNNFIFAYDQFRKYGKTVKGVQNSSLMAFEDVAAYKIEDGVIQSIMDPKSRMIDATEIDECSRKINSVFDKLMAMEEE